VTHNRVKYAWAIVTRQGFRKRWVYQNFFVHEGDVVLYGTRAEAREAAAALRTPTRYDGWFRSATPVRVRVTVAVVE